MSYDASLIAPYQSGLSKYYKPFLIGNDAFTSLINCYSWRGFIKKREGSSVLGRLPKWATSTGITDASPPVVTSAAHGLLTGDMVWLENVVTTNGVVTGIASGLTTVVTTAGAHGISAGQKVIVTASSGISTVDPTITFNDTVFIAGSVTANTITLNVSTTGTYIAGGTVLLGNLEKQAFQITKINANSFSLQDLNSGANVVASGVATSADIYLPVLGVRTFILASTGNEQLIAFHSKQAFLFDTSTQTFTNISFNTAAAAIRWEGTKDNFFWTSNFASVMWATNNVCNTTTGVPADDQVVGIRFYNGSTTAGWADFQPQVNSVFLNSALIVLPYKGRLVALNTTEGTVAAPPGEANSNFFTRARWSQVGTPFVANAPTGFSNDANAWRDDIPGKGGYIDADTSERIVSAAIVQDTLIVAFQFSTWRLRWTADQTLPFIWERINTHYGSEATFSTVPFDQGMATISRRGIVMAGFNDVERIDLAIPDFCDQFETGSIGEGLVRIQGIRDFQKRLVYWIYGDEGQNQQTPNQVLCYNYQDNTWSTFDQSFTCLGNYKWTIDNTWSTWTSIWDGDTSTWDTPLDQSNTLIVVAGSKDSNVWRLMDPDVSTDNGTNFNFQIITNLINPYFQEGKRCRLAYYDLYLTNTDDGQVTLYNYTDDDPSNPWLIKTVNTNDNSISLNPVKNTKYIRVFLGMTARQHQIKISLTPTQLADADIGASDFEMQGVIFHTRMEGRIKQ